MNSIHTNLASMVAQNSIHHQARQLQQSLTRLSTGLRINRASDDPAGFVAAESHRANIVAMNAAMSNAGRAEQMLNAADAGLQELGDLLLDLQSVVLGATDDSADDSSARLLRQNEVDALLQAIDRVANTTTFNNTQLLNGGLEYKVENLDLLDVERLDVHSARIAAGGATNVGVHVEVESSATRGSLFIDVDSAGSTGTFNNGGEGSVTFELSGPRGVQQFTFSEGTMLSDMVSIINSFTAETGLVAVESTENVSIKIESDTYGTEGFVQARIIEGHVTGFEHIYDDEPSAGNTIWYEDLRVDGVDAAVRVNGVMAVCKGLTVRSMNPLADVTIEMTEFINSTQGTTQFDIVGGGAVFNFGSELGRDLATTIGIESMTTGRLGGMEGVLASLRSGNDGNMVDGDIDLAEQIVQSAMDRVAQSRSRIGAFQQYTIGSAVRHLSLAIENATSAQSQVRDADIAVETAALTQAQVIQQAAMYALEMANTQSMTVLSLLD